MSKTRQILELNNPSIQVRHERITGLVQKCNYCQGNGWFWGTDEWGESEKQDCPLCKGSGCLRPVITIDWEPVCRK